MTMRTTALAMTVAIATLAVRPALADQIIYWTDFGGHALKQTDVTTSTTTTLTATPTTFGSGNPDSLIFDPAGNIIYSMHNGSPGTVRKYSTTGSDTLLTGGFSNGIVDLALDPSGTSVLLTDQGGSLFRIDLGSGTPTTLRTGMGKTDGIAYDPSGNLYMVSGGTVLRLDPTTGATLATGTAATQDGLTFDPVTGHLFAANAGCLQEINPTTLAAIACYPDATTSFAALDGVVSDGAGHIILADVGAGAVKSFDVSSHAVTVLFSAPGLDDIAPLTGLGSPPVPEPATLSLFGLALAGLGAARRWLGRQPA